VGNLAANAIIDGRKKKNSFNTLTDFLINIDPHFLNKKVLEA
jgi:DNA polymerase III alpha subunit